MLFFIGDDLERLRFRMRCATRTVSRFGRLDAAVNCTGTESTPGPLTEQTAETYAGTFDTNVLGPLLSMKHEMRVTLAQGRGSIVNISSTYGHAAWRCCERQ